MAKKWDFERIMSKMFFSKIKSEYDSDIASKAIELSIPFIEDLLKSQKLLGKDRYLIVGNIMGEVLATRSFGINNEWKCAYDLYAKSRFNISVSTREQAKINGEEGTFFWGSHIDGEILVVSSSEYPHIDETINKIVASVTRLLITSKKIGDINFK